MRQTRFRWTDHPRESLTNLLPPCAVIILPVCLEISKAHRAIPQQNLVLWYIVLLPDQAPPGFFRRWLYIVLFRGLRELNVDPEPRVVDSTYIASLRGRRPSSVINTSGITRVRIRGRRLILTGHLPKEPSKADTCQSISWQHPIVPQGPHGRSVLGSGCAHGRSHTR